MGERQQNVIFSPARLGPLELRNRIIRAGCFEGMCQNESPTDDLQEHHKTVARGGVAMTTVAYCAVSREGLAFGHEMWMRPEVVPALRRLTDAVHREGAAASIQLGHCGFFANHRVTGGDPLGPSAMFCTYRLHRSRGMTEEDMTRVGADFARAASTAREAGFDAVEIHAGHGYLLSQFLSPWTNRRRDAYGGTLANRVRFPASVVQGVREAVGPEFPVIVKMNLCDGFRGGLEVPDSVQVARRFEKSGASALVLSCGFTTRTPFHMLRGRIPIREMARAEKNPTVKASILLMGRLLIQHVPYDNLFLLEEARHVRRAVSMPLVLIGGVCSRKHMETAVREGFDFVQIGRATIRDPDIVEKMQSGEVDGSDCDHCNRCVGLIMGGPVRCVTRDEESNCA